MRFKFKCTILLVFLLGPTWVVPSRLVGSNFKQVDTLSSQCLSGKSSACLRLADIAVTDQDWSVRRAALLGLNDQALFAKIAVADKNLDVRLGACPSNQKSRCSATTSCVRNVLASLHAASKAISRTGS
jgi:hypothetical protein